MLNIITYNLNGIRAALGKGLAEWLAVEQPDIFCVQETKALESDVPPLELEALGYHYRHWFSAEKKGYSGVATFSKIKPDYVSTETGIEVSDREGRILRTDFGDLTLLNCYFPSGTSGEERQAVKMKFLDDFYDFVSKLIVTRPNILVVGDFNIAHTEKDIHDPKGNKNSSGFLPEERAWMSKWLDFGFIDTFRHTNPELIEYSWWTFRAGARANNKGWRIDYQTASEALRDRVRDARQLNDVVHSDHCPVKLLLD